jgi:hypothetical protein
MRFAFVFHLLFSLALSTSIGGQNRAAVVVIPCVVTTPTSPSMLSSRSRALSVSLPRQDGTVVFKPGGVGFVLSDGALSMKFGWERAVRGPLRISGRRLDESAPPLRSHIPSGYGETGFQATALIFPTPGCWEVTGRVGDEILTFVTRVVKVA